MFARGIGLKDVQPLTAVAGLADPLKTVVAISGLIGEAESAGYSIEISDNFANFASLRRLLRDSDISPMFDPMVSRGLAERGFWMAARDKDQNIVACQAFRLDEAEPSLADWVLGWMMGLYAKRREMIIPRAVQPPEHSLTHLIRGRVVYHGELFVDKHSRGCFNFFPRIGMLLALVKWQPEAIWALVGASMATRGHMIRMGYGHLEQSFLTWDWEPDGAEKSEWIGISERRHLEFQVADMITKVDKYSPLQAP